MLEFFIDAFGRVIRPVWRRMRIRLATGWRQIMRKDVWSSSQSNDILSSTAPPRKRLRHLSVPEIQIQPDALTQQRVAFFDLLKSGTLSALQIMVNNVEPEIKVSLAESYNEKGETPLIVAIQRKSLPLVKYLIHTN